MPKSSRTKKDVSVLLQPSIEWWRESMPPTIEKPGLYEATIASTKTTLGYSGCAWEIREKLSSIALRSESKRSRSDSSNEQRGYVAAAVGAVATFKGRVELTIWSNSKYVTEGLNGGAQGWKDNNWLGANGKPIKNRELWQLILRLSAERQITLVGRHDSKDNHIPYDRVMELAKRACAGN